MSDIVKFSQQNEQPVILHHCPAQGRFLEVGAFNSRIFSNTRALYERGWSGVMIEPSPMPMHGLLADYGNDPRITLISAAVGLEKQLIKMHVTQDALSTTSDEFYGRWSNGGTQPELGGFYGSFLIPQITFDDIFLQFTGDFQFVSIDTEGTSAELFKAMLATGVRPHVVCFEHDKRLAELFPYYDEAGYLQVHLNDVNVILARKS